MSEYNKESNLSAEIKKYMLEQENPTKSEVIPESPEEKAVSEIASTNIEISETEKQARALGWKSKEERLAEGKNNDHYVDPDEYVRRQPLFERIERQNKELRDFKDKQKMIEQHLAQIRQEAYNQALRDLESRREAAVASANMEEFRKIDQQARQMQQQMTFDPIIKPTVPAEVEDFARRNSSWFNDSTAENSKMKAAAEAADSYLARAARIDGRQINPNEHLEMIENEIKRLFPHRFNIAHHRFSTVQSNTSNTEQNVNSPSASSVSRSSAPTGNIKPLNNLVGRLTAQQKALGEHFMKTNPQYTLEMYAKDLELMGRLGK